ncbi:unnamed protein product [Rotaria magnacalcarata]|uniref:DDE Tnp4 domain-containing protein n=2 Tax=Rotaria magnacalcarata TaxID=392030 RepID=A0A816SGH6_9BILA|nr:unnamed protein product [Rotaria magnacalcarata]
MASQYVRFVKSSNQDFLCNIPSQGAIHLKTVHPVLHHQHTVPSLQFLQQRTPTTGATPARIIIKSSPSTLNLSHEAIIQKNNNSIAAIPIRQTYANSSSCVGISVVKSSTNEVMPTTVNDINGTIKSEISNITPPVSKITTPPSNQKRVYSPRSESAERSKNQSAKKKKCDEKDMQIMKRRNWTEPETMCFIEVWTEYYPKLISAGSRNSPIYQAMANQLNNMLTNRSVRAPDIINAPLPDSNFTQVSEQVEDSIPLTVNTDESNSIVRENSNNSASPSSINSNSKCDNVAKVSPTTKKTVPARKKRISEIKMDLIKELVGKIESASEVASRSEVKMDDKKLMCLLHSYLTRKIRLNAKIARARAECQRVIKNYRNNLILRNQLITSVLLLLDNTSSITNRSIWSHKKNGKWWAEIVPLMTDQQFKENFRIERQTFSSLLQQLQPHIQKSDTNYRAAIPIDKRLACALYALGSSSESRTVGHLFGIGKSTASEILHDICSVLIGLFFHRLVKFPNTDLEIQETINGFSTKYGHSLCVGALDGSHIAIKPPLGQEIDYFNYKKHHSVILLATVNSDLLFTYVNIGAPGRCNDSSIYNNSTLSSLMQHPIYQNHVLVINNVKVQSHLIADSAFSLSSTLLKPYADKPNMPKCQSLFNYRLSRVRCSVERAFGCLKNRFRLLHCKMEYELGNAINLIKAATILHNICISSGDKVEIDWDTPLVIHKKPSCNIQTNSGTDSRDALKDFFLMNPL